MLSFYVKCAVLVLAELESAGNVGKGLRTGELKKKLGYPPGLQRVLSIMKDARLVEQDVYRGWYSLKTDLATLSLWELITKVDPCQQYWGDWPTDGESYPGITGFVTDMEEYLKQKAAGITIYSLIHRSA